MWGGLSQLLGPYNFFDGVQRNSLLAHCKNWCGTTPYAQNINANANVAAAMASPQVSGAPAGRRRPYSMTAAIPAIATTKDITNATTRAGATSLALWPSARHRRRDLPREISHILMRRDQ